jgi:hypothetical protein
MGALVIGVAPLTRRLGRLSSTNAATFARDLQNLNREFSISEYFDRLGVHQLHQSLESFVVHLVFLHAE